MNWINKFLSRITGNDNQDAFSNNYKRIEVLESKIVELNRVNSILEGYYLEVERLKNEKANDKKIKELLDGQILQLTKDNVRLKKENDKVRTVVKEKDTFAQQLQNKIVQQRELIDSLNSTSNSKSGQINELNKSLSSESEKLKTIIKTNELQQSKILKEEEDINNLNVKIKNLFEEHQKEVQQYEVKISQQNELLDRLTINSSQKIKEITQLNEILTSQIESLTDKLEKNKKQKDLLQGAIMTKGKTIKQLNEAYQSVTELLEQEKLSLKNEKQKYELIIKRKEEKINELNAEVSTQNNQQINKYKEEINSLETQIQRLEEEISDKSTEISSIQLELQNKDKQFNKQQNKLINLLTEKRQADEMIVSLNGNIEKLNRKITSLEEEKKQLLEHSQIMEESNKKISQDKNVINVSPVSESKEDPKGKEVVTNKPATVTNDSKENSSSIVVTSETTATPLNQQLSPQINNKLIKQSSNKSKESIIIEKCEGAIEDFPTITNDANHLTRRRIEFVIDEINKKRIYADDFFNGDIESIAKESRNLAEASINGQLYWTCGCCRKPVKIGHRTINDSESLFFVHTEKLVNCPWSPQSSDTIRAPKSNLGLVEIPDESTEITDKVDDNTSNLGQEVFLQPSKIKELMFSLLSTPKSLQQGISDIKIDPIIISKIPFLRWKRPDLSFKYKDRLIVFIIQKVSHTVSQIVDRDIFFRLNNIHIMWIFTSNNNTSYDNMRKLTYKDTMFDNHRNVFVFDEDAREQSIKADELLLKCNWLNECNEWSIKVATSGNNGKLIHCNQLIFDDEYCKPYYIDANKIYFDKHPDAGKAYLNNLKSRNELIEAIEEKWTRDSNYMEAQSYMRLNNLKASTFEHEKLWGFKFNTTLLITPIFTKRPIELPKGYWLVENGNNLGIVNQYGQKIIDWNGVISCSNMTYDEINHRILFERGGKWGVADSNGTEIIPPKYEEISAWHKDLYKIKIDEKYQLINSNNETVNDLHFEYIDDLKGNRAKACICTNQRNELRIREGYLNGKGQIIYTTTKKLDNELILVEEFEYWGIIDIDNNIIVPCKYDNILPWSGDLIRVEEQNLWGILNIKTMTYHIPLSYQSIGDLMEEKALVSLNGSEYFINIENQYVAEESIELQGGLLKTKIAGKWGIINNQGEEIISHKYNEIGSFRSRLIGVINGRIIKLNASYLYPINISGKYLYDDEKKIYIDIYGVKCFIIKSTLINCGYSIEDFCLKENVYKNLGFVNLIFGKGYYELRIVNEQSLAREISHGDLDTDFKLGEVVTGHIKSQKKTKGCIKKVLVEFDNGKKTYVRFKHFKDCNKDVNNYSINDTIKIRKVDYDSELDQTVWEILD